MVAKYLKATAFLLSALLILALQGCGGTKAEPQTLKLGLLPIEDNIPLYVAEQEELFENAGVTVELINFPSAQEMTSAMQAGQIDGKITDMIVSALLKKSGTDIKIAALGSGATPQEGRFAILSSPQSPVRTMDQLKNVKIGATENTIVHYVTDALFKQAGLNQQDVAISPVPKMPVRLDMLLSNQIEAAVFPEPLASFAELQGAHVVADDTTADISQTVFIFRTAVIDSNPEAVKAVLKAYGQGREMLNENPDKYRDLFVKEAQVPQPMQETYQIPAFSPLQLPTEAQVANVMDWMVGKKLLEQPYSYKDMVDPDLLP